MHAISTTDFRPPVAATYRLLRSRGALPGDLVLTGSPLGDGRYGALRPGDVMESEITVWVCSATVA